MCVAMGHEFIGLLGRRVERYGMIHIVMHREGHVRIAPIDGAGRGIHEMFHLVVPTPLEDVEKPVYIAAGIGMRIGERIPHTSLRGEMDDAPELTLRKKRLHPGAIGEVELGELKVGVASDLCKAGFLEPYVIVGIQIIQPDDVLSPFKQPFGKMEPDKARCTGDQDQSVVVTHRVSLRSCRVPLLHAAQI